jgi:hypothetical protein
MGEGLGGGEEKIEFPRKGADLMKKTLTYPSAAFVAILLAFLLFGFNEGLAHCDGMDGPVVTAAQKALETGDVNLVLIWVQKKDEGEIRRAFQKTLAVRKLGPEARDLADMNFFETLVRLHRAGEGEPYTGIKPAGRDLGPAVPAGDKAVADGKLEPLYKLLTNAIHDGLHDKFEKVIMKRNFNKENVDAGREYVEAYVIFIHYVETLYDTARKGVHGHSSGHQKAEGHDH